MSTPRVVIRDATESDSHGLIRLFQGTPQEGRLVINFERSPNFFWGANVVAQEPLTIVAEDKETQRIIGSVSFGRKRVFINGKAQWLRYGNDLHLNANYRAGRTLLKLYRGIGERFSAGEWCHTAILSDNQPSLNTIAKGRAGLPKYHFLNHVYSHLIYINKQKPSLNRGFSVRRASACDAPLLQGYFDTHGPKKQFFPVYDFNRLGKDDYYRDIRFEDYFLLFDNDELLGVVGVWDQQAFKQTRFVAYRGIFKVLKPLYNAYSRLFGGLILPNAGETLPYQVLHSVLIKEDNVEVFSVLLREIYRHLRHVGCEAVVCGLAEGDVLGQALQGYRYRTSDVSHFVGTFDDFDPRDSLEPTSPVYFEPARW